MNRATVYESGEGREVLGSPPVLRLLAGAPDDPIAITESTIPPGFPGPVRHRHREMFDIFYLLEGALTFHLGGEDRVVSAGGYVMVPPGVVHTFSNPAAEPARMLNIYHPPGLEQYVVEVARRMAAGQRPTREEMAELAAPHDFHPVGTG